MCMQFRPKNGSKKAPHRKRGSQGRRYGSTRRQIGLWEEQKKARQSKLLCLFCFTLPLRWP